MISLCQNCLCMTHTIKKRCGKCKEYKIKIGFTDEELRVLDKLITEAYEQGEFEIRDWLEFIKIREK
jgi:hypothetical protein